MIVCLDGDNLTALGELAMHLPHYNEIMQGKRLDTLNSPKLMTNGASI